MGGHVSRRQLQYGLAVVWFGLYAYLLVAYVGRGNLSLLTPLVVFAAVFMADLAGGIAHFVVDYTPNVSGVGLYELFHYEGNKGGKAYIKLRGAAMKKINAFHEVVFDFKVHHLSPGALGRRPIAQMTLPIIVFADLPITLILVPLSELGVIPADVTLFMLMFLAAATVSQYAHSCTHRKQVPAIARFLQTTRLFVSAEAHDVHHRDPTRSFCLLNGWSNPVVDVLFQLTLKLGIFKANGLEVIR